MFGFEFFSCLRIELCTRNTQDTTLYIPVFNKVFYYLLGYIAWYSKRITYEGTCIGRSNCSIDTKRPNDNVNIVVLRDGKEKEITVKLQKNDSFIANDLGVIIKNLSDKDKKDFKLKEGVKITKTSPLYAENGINLDGKVLISINGKEVKDIDSAKSILENNKSQRYAIIVQNKNGEKERYFL